MNTWMAKGCMNANNQTELPFWFTSLFRTCIHWFLFGGKDVTFLLHTNTVVLLLFFKEISSTFLFQLKKCVDVKLLTTSVRE